MTRLIDAATLRDRLGEPGLLLVDVRSEQDWRAATLPGAVMLNVYDYFIPSSDEAGLRDIERATARGFAAAGIDGAKTVVFFEQRTGMISPRGLWFHEFAGHSGGLVLDGGIEAWLAIGGPTEAGQVIAAAIRSTEGEDVPPMDRTLIATLAEMTDPAPDADILDVRRRTEFTGEFVHDCCARPGRIGGSKFLFWEDLIRDGAYRPVDEIRALALDAGLSPDRTIITYCHRGARAATAHVALREAGFPRTKIFVGSWHEYAGRTDLPVALGEPGDAAA